MFLLSNFRLFEMIKLLCIVDAHCSIEDEIACFLHKQEYDLIDNLFDSGITPIFQSIFCSSFLLWNELNWNDLRSHLYYYEMIWNVMFWIGYLCILSKPCPLAWNSWDANMLWTRIRMQCNWLMETKLKYLIFLNFKGGIQTNPIRAGGQSRWNRYPCFSSM